LFRLDAGVVTYLAPVRMLSAQNFRYLPRSDQGRCVARALWQSRVSGCGIAFTRSALSRFVAVRAAVAVQVTRRAATLQNAIFARMLSGTAL
jgi:hypothetical protein